MANLLLYDTTLRDGSQQEGISLSVEDKLSIAAKIDELGVHYIEGGWPGANPRDDEFFRRMREVKLKHAKLVAFGSTRRAGGVAKTDRVLSGLLEAETPVVTIVGKSWDLHVTEVLETSLEENLEMIRDSIQWLKQNDREVIFDAEHFFDGFHANPDYATKCLQAAAESGADCLALCDTNGGTLPHDISRIVIEVGKQVAAPLGIHVHNDVETAVAGSLAAIQAGAVQVQGTINGYGERCGNANLLSIIANLQLKMGVQCVQPEQMVRLTEVSRFVSEVVNIPLADNQPYVGNNAFTHKAGLHAAAVGKVERSYQHIDPPVVGNTNAVLISDLAGRGNVLFKLEQMGLQGALSDDQVRDLVSVVKERESQGFQYEVAEASFELLVLRQLPDYKPKFELVDYFTFIEQKKVGADDMLGVSSEATVKLQMSNEVVHTAGHGVGPVHALDSALRKALSIKYPDITKVRLVDYKVRVVSLGEGTASVVRVLVESSQGGKIWQTVGASANIIEATWMALYDSLEYWLLDQDID